MENGNEKWLERLRVAVEDYRAPVPPSVKKRLAEQGWTGAEEAARARACGEGEPVPPQEKTGTPAGAPDGTLRESRLRPEADARIPGAFRIRRGQAPGPGTDMGTDLTAGAGVRRLRLRRIAAAAAVAAAVAGLLLSGLREAGGPDPQVPYRMEPADSETDGAGLPDSGFGNVTGGGVSSGALQPGNGQFRRGALTALAAREISSAGDGRTAALDGAAAEADLRNDAADDAADDAAEVPEKADSPAEQPAPEAAEAVSGETREEKTERLPAGKRERKSARRPGRDGTSGPERNLRNGKRVRTVEDYGADRNRTGGRRNGWMTGLAVANAGLSAGNVSGAGFGGGAALMGPQSDFASVPAGAEVVFLGGTPYLSDRKQAYSYRHRPPLSFGLYAGKRVAPRVRLETGLTYTLLLSDVTADTGAEMGQSLHFLGIPLRAGWHFWEGKHFGAYAGGGVMAEKCVWGTLGGKKLTVKEWQYSVFAAPGIEFAPAGRFSLYLEPGAAYYFGNGSAVRTLRRDSPLDFTLQLGFRFTY